MQPANPTAQTASFQSAQPRGRWAIILLGVGVALDIVALVFEWFQVNLLNQVLQGKPITLDEATANDDRLRFVGVAQLLIYLVTAILVLIWIHRSYRNLPALGATDLKFTPGWAVGWFFVPFMNLFRPFQVMTELWKASDPAVSASDATARKSASTPPLLGAWWAAWLIGNILVQVATRVIRRDEIGAAITATWLVMLSDILNIAAAVLLINIIRSVDTSQQKKADDADIAISDYASGTQLSGGSN